MRTYRKSITVASSPDQVYAVIEDLSRYRDFFVGITKWDPVGPVTHEVGDRFWVLMDVGSIQTGGQIVITEMVPGKRLAWESEKGTDHGLTFDITPVGEGSRIDVALELRLAGGMLSRLAERVAGSIVRRNLIATLQSLRHVVTYGTG